MIALMNDHVTVERLAIVTWHRGESSEAVMAWSRAERPARRGTWGVIVRVGATVT